MVAESRSECLVRASAGQSGEICVYACWREYGLHLYLRAQRGGEWLVLALL